MTSTVKTRIFVLSDTHAGFQGRSTDSYAKEDGSFRPPLPKADVLLHSGDLTMVGTMQEYRSAIALLKGIDAELKLVIAGNHELSLHADYYLGSGRSLSRSLQSGFYDESMAKEAAELWSGPEAKAAGVTYLTEGLHKFELSNGAKFTVYASPWQPVFCHWAFNYPKNEDRWNPPHLVHAEPSGPFKNAYPAPEKNDPHPIPEGTTVDVMMTHGPPWMHLDKCARDDYRAGCPHLLRALDRVRPRLHCFGHIHEAWGAERVKWKGDQDPAEGPGIQKPDDVDVRERRAAYVDVSSESSRPLIAGKETLLVNSCIMSLSYKAHGAAWLVDMDLPKGTPQGF
ncbi:ser/Thr protein phosphatase family protein [Tothia fuscella]|uniref:Ser/Thr protein phosphatase family protein n=1 Tax=Tothia fuscella TaxID=1048955 RepID=A0A9P4U478_9PEZI|nr:ser/Thr protein phosphatase family protein [Tothia fuscella]